MAVIRIITARNLKGEGEGEGGAFFTAGRGLTPPAWRTENENSGLTDFVGTLRTAAFEPLQVGFTTEKLIDDMLRALLCYWCLAYTICT